MYLAKVVEQGVHSAMYRIPVVITLVWLVVIVITDSFDRIFMHWESTLTMTLGSFLGGSSPAGGGVIAFPVFTKVLDVPAPVARTFTLSIQAIGLTVAAVTMLLARRPFEPRVVVIGALAGSAGFLVALLLLGDRSTPFWELEVPTSYIKVTFTLILAVMAYVMFMTLRVTESDYGVPRILHWNRRVWTGLAFAAFIGGMVTAMIGTGANVVLFLFTVTILGLNPRVGITSSIIAMAVISVLGLLVLGFGHGQLNVELAPRGEVVAIGGTQLGPLSADRYDLLGLWLAAIPVVVWGAPLGTHIVHLVKERTLVAFVGTLAVAEVLSTFILLEDLHTDPILIGYCIVGLICLPMGVSLLRRYRTTILNLDD